MLSRVKREKGELKKGRQKLRNVVGKKRVKRRRVSSCRRPQSMAQPEENRHTS